MLLAKVRSMFGVHIEGSLAQTSTEKDNRRQELWLRVLAADTVDPLLAVTPARRGSARVPHLRLSQAVAILMTGPHWPCLLFRLTFTEWGWGTPLSSLGASQLRFSTYCEPVVTGNDQPITKVILLVGRAAKVAGSDWSRWRAGDCWRQTEVCSRFRPFVIEMRWYNAQPERFGEHKKNLQGDMLRQSVLCMEQSTPTLGLLKNVSCMPSTPKFVVATHSSGTTQSVIIANLNLFTSDRSFTNHCHKCNDTHKGMNDFLLFCSGTCRRFFSACNAFWMCSNFGLLLHLCHCQSLQS